MLSMVAFYAMVSTTALVATVAMVGFVCCDSGQWPSLSWRLRWLWWMVTTMALVAIVAMVALFALTPMSCGVVLPSGFYQPMPCDALSQAGDFDALSKSAGARTSKPIRPGNEAG